MSTNTALLALGKAVASDVTQTYLTVTLAAALDILDNASTLAGVQTLTNKTLTAPHMTTPVVDSGGLQVGGNLGIGSATVAVNKGVALTQTVTGAANEMGYDAALTADSSGTTAFTGYRVGSMTGAASTTHTLMAGFAISGNGLILGAAGAVTTAAGLSIAAQNIVATRSIGVDVGAMSGGSSQNLGMRIAAQSGTAPFALELAGGTGGYMNIVTGGSTTISTGVGSVKMSTGNAATNTSWIPIAYAGTVYFVPGWTTNAP